MLEGMRPMNFVMSQGMVFFSPLVKILFESAHFDQIQEMLEKREAIPYIIELIEIEEEASRGQNSREVNQQDQQQESPEERRAEDENRDKKGGSCG